MLTHSLWQHHFWTLFEC